MNIQFGDGHVHIESEGFFLYTDAEVAKANGFHTPDVGGGKRNGISVPKGARWFWARISDERPDLQNEIVDSETLRKFSDYVVQQAGWVDLNHWSRPSKFPEQLAKAGRSPEEYVIGSLTELRVSPDGTSFAEGFLWPKGENEHADTAWQWLRMAPEKVHCSVGGPAISRKRERGKDGKYVTRLKMLMNHLAICNQGVHVDTEVQTEPFGEFTKAIIDGVADEPCDGDGCFACYVRGEHVESAKGAVSAGGEGGINAMGAVPEDLEGAKEQGLSADDEDKELDSGSVGEGAANNSDGLGDGMAAKSVGNVTDCGHFCNGKLPRDRAVVVSHLVGCLGFQREYAHELYNGATS